MSEERVNHPKHYNRHPSGIECIDVVGYMSFNLGNAVKYIWRADEKGKADEDLEKAIWYIRRELEQRKKKAEQHSCVQPESQVFHTGDITPPYFLHNCAQA